MVDMLPFLRTSGSTTEQQLAEVISYLLQFKETLEFVLTNISFDNFSPDVKETLDKLAEIIANNNAEKEDEFEQFIKNNVLSLRINFETGNLDYFRN